MRQVFLDTETTGLHPDQGDRIIEFACVEYDRRRDTGRRLHHYVNPGRSSHPDAVRVHGISDEFLADKPPFASVVAELLDFVKGADVVIHNASFDVGFLNAELARLGLPLFTQHAARITDSLQMAREMFPGKGNSLDALCRRLEVDNSKRDLHGALIDADLLAQVYLNMTRGQDSLVIDSTETSRGPVAAARLDLSTLDLPVLACSEDEAAAHDALLCDLDKVSQGKTVWRTPEPAQNAMA
ncbi:MAG: DNA polymerase III subunit epsilon [Rubrivivax sp.]|nr:DNA polymerase III subunit epsilon [Rubrivivax sp.]MDP3611966.1 DNA polymerase III subunit epsilon [Rubrivivax sp.]